MFWFVRSVCKGASKGRVESWGLRGAAFEPLDARIWFGLSGLSGLFSSFRLFGLSGLFCLFSLFGLFGTEVFD